MKYLPILGLIGLVLLFITDLNAENIYSWTDENGVRQYSNAAPGKDAKDVKIIKGIPHTQDDERKSRQREAENRAAEIEREIEREENDKKIEAEKKKAAQDKLNKKIQAEKERLQNEIRRIEQRSTRNFSLGMKKSRIKEYQEKLDLLERSPEEYFAANAP